MEDYNKLRVIGKGSYGEVWLVKHRRDRKQVRSSDLFAIGPVAFTRGCLDPEIKTKDQHAGVCCCCTAFLKDTPVHWSSGKTCGVSLLAGWTPVLGCSICCVEQKYWWKGLATSRVWSLCLYWHESALFFSMSWRRWNWGMHPEEREKLQNKKPNFCRNWNIPTLCRTRIPLKLNKDFCT